MFNLPAKMPPPEYGIRTHDNTAIQAAISAEEKAETQLWAQQPKFFSIAVAMVFLFVSVAGSTYSVATHTGHNLVLIFDAITIGAVLYNRHRTKALNVWTNKYLCLQLDHCSRFLRNTPYASMAIQQSQILAAMDHLRILHASLKPRDTRRAMHNVILVHTNMCEEHYPYSLKEPNESSQENIAQGLHHLQELVKKYEL